MTTTVDAEAAALPPGTGPEENPQASTYRSRLAEIRDKIGALESQLAVLRTEEHKTLESIIYPILTLPTDITSEIFLHYMGYPFKPQVDSNPFTLASVCRHWRDVAFSTCGLWPAFHVNSLPLLPPNIEGILNLLRSWLSRVGAIPFRVDIGLPASASSEILSILAPYTSQLLNLNLQLSGPVSFPAESGPLSSLMEMSIDAGDEDILLAAFLDAPRLQKATLLGTTLTQVSLPWIQLTTLVLCDQSVRECLEILRETPNLTTLDLFSNDADNVALSTPLELRHLRTLQSSSMLLLDHLTLPALEELEARNFDESDSLIVRDLVTRSGCSVRKFSLFRGALHETDNCVSALPTLRDLTLTSVTCDWDELEGFLTRIGERILLPALESLTLNDVGASFPLSSVTAMLSARAASVDGAAGKMKTFLFSRGEPCWEAVVVDKALSDLRDLRSKGMTIDLRWGPEWFGQASDFHL
ncbi:hypothetical protein B0H11DRAFT_469335 [Mycena galericulata]|nr:hypothetical protein B0H11DRAFT_469335 [Mycena galericulata]